MTIGEYIRTLTEAGTFQSDDIALHKRVLEIRNRAVHALTEPTADDVRFKLSFVRKFVAKYLVGGHNVKHIF
jgi:hypothetical protein